LGNVRLRNALTLKSDSAELFSSAAPPRAAAVCSSAGTRGEQRSTPLPGLQPLSRGLCASKGELLLRARRCLLLLRLRLFAARATPWLAMAQEEAHDGAALQRALSARAVQKKA
jgi:hypothetical protein